MTPEQYITKQSPDRKSLLSEIHSIILQEDKMVGAAVGLMMGKEMILYKERGHFKYGLASVKNYMSIHIMPIYGGSPLHARYRELLPRAEFQKGCINFTIAEDVPLEVIRRLFADCSKVNIGAMREKNLRK